MCYPPICNKVPELTLWMYLIDVQTIHECTLSKVAQVNIKTSMFNLRFLEHFYMNFTVIKIREV